MYLIDLGLYLRWSRLTGSFMTYPHRKRGSVMAVECNGKLVWIEVSKKFGLKRLFLLKC